jgi:hypothetical protein
VRDIGRYDPRPCQVEQTDWPYDCEARDQHPDHLVFVCTVHMVWWHRAPAEVAAAEQATGTGRSQRS